MSRQDRARAQRISEYVDGLVVHRREERLRPFSAEDREFRELAGLARVLSAIDVTAPQDFREDLCARLPRMAATGAFDDRSWLGGSRWFSRRVAALVRPLARWFSPLPGTLRTAAAMALLVALAVTFVSQLASTPTVSAAEILSRSDLALAKLLRPGEVLYRRWKVTDRITGAGRPDTVRAWTSHEWMDGSDFAHVAGRRYSVAGRLLLAYVSMREDGEVRPRVYFAPGFLREPRGLLSTEPSRREFQEAIAQFPPEERAVLKTYLDRGYIYEPIAGERRFNRTLLESPASASAELPQIMLSLDRSKELNGIPVFAVRIVEPIRIQFRWRSDGPPSAWVTRQETVRYIAQDTFLSLRSEEIQQFRDGRRGLTTLELLETRLSEAGAQGVNPFELEVPEETPLRRQSAHEQLSAVARVLRRIPPMLSSSSPSAPASAAGTPAQPTGRR